MQKDLTKDAVSPVGITVSEKGTEQHFGDFESPDILGTSAYPTRLQVDERSFDFVSRCACKEFTSV